MKRTTIKVELIKRLAFGAKDGFIYKLRAKAIAPLILPLNQIIINCFRSILSWNFLQIPTRSAGIKTPKALAIIQEIRTAKKNE